MARCRAIWIRSRCSQTGNQVKGAAARIGVRLAGARGHVFNLGHGILPETPVENVRMLAEYVQQQTTKAAVI